MIAIANGCLISNFGRYKHGYLRHFQKRIFVYIYPSSPQPHQRGVVLLQRVLLTLLLRNALDQVPPENSDVSIKYLKNQVYDRSKLIL